MHNPLFAKVALVIDTENIPFTGVLMINFLQRIWGGKVIFYLKN
jgi:hypothetical protein